MTVEVLERPAVIGAASATIAVVVTQDDIDRGKQGSARGCAIALAFERIGISAVIGTLGAGAIGGYEYTCRSARQWTVQFDRDKTRVHPERFVWQRVDQPRKETTP